MGGSSYVGLWNTPDREDAYETGPIWTDLFITTFCIAFFTALISPKGVRDSVKKGQQIPVPDEELAKGVWAYFPLRVRSFCVRSLVIALEAMVLLGGLTLLLLVVSCESGLLETDPDTDNSATCQMTVNGFIAFKSMWAGVVGGLVMPFVYLGALNRKHLPEEVYENFVQHVRLRDGY